MGDFTKGSETFSLSDESLEGRLRAWAALHVSTGNARSRTHDLCAEAADALAEQTAVREALRAADAWLNGWADHMGRCATLGGPCTCGLVAARAQVRAALAKAAPEKETE